MGELIICDIVAFMANILDKIFNRTQTFGVKKFEPLVAKINSLEEGLRLLDNAQLKAKTAEFRSKLQSNPDTEAILPEAFAVVREMARRTLGERHFDVQLIGGMVLNSGAIAEMRTGEGKTLVATLSAYLNALLGKGVHVVTVNDYLSRRDAVWMGQIFDALGLTVGVINHEASYLYDPKAKSNSEKSSTVAARQVSGELDETDTSSSEEGEDFSAIDAKRDEIGSFKVVYEFLKPCNRREAYEADITYGTNSEFGFDYLRDNLEYSPDKLRQRPFNYAIVDEIDSILIDEARTPLIISAPTRDAESTYKQFASLVSSYKEDQDYIVDQKKRAISILGPGMEKAEKMLGVDNIYTDKGIKFVHHLETAIKAKALYHKDKEYVVRDNEIIIVDEFTGRLQPGRRWSEGLHQAIEAKEGAKIQQESRTYASITYQNFFRMYPKLSGMTGTAATSSEEFFKVYGLSVYVVPTNKPITRMDKQDQIFRTEIGKYKAIARKVKEIHQKGQPVLIGTVSIEKNELLSQFLKSEGVPHQILNAKPEYAEKEGEIVAQAGKKGAVTIATNMAGRGVDIKLGGSPNTKESYEEVKSAGGLFVLGTERHEARRIDNQLRGRSGRQGDPGETQFFVSLDDNLMRVFASDTLKSMMGKLGMPEDEPIEHRLISRALENAQEKIEGLNFDSRKHVLEFDDVINTQRKSIYEKRRKILLGSVEEVEAELLCLVIPANSVIPAKAGISSVESQDPDFRRDDTGGSQDDTGSSLDDTSSILTKKIAQFGREAFLSAARIVLLQTIDMFWVEHLEVMDYTRSSVNLRAYGQRDPLVEYKKEGLRLFREMQEAMKDQVQKILPNIVPLNSPQTPVVPNNQPTQSQDQSHQTTGRNDPCWCGSGKKFKRCHGK